MPELPEPLSFATTVAAFDLPGSEMPAWSAAIPTDRWPRYLRALLDYRLTGLATAALEVDQMPLAAGQADELVQAQREAMVWALTLDKALLGIQAAFNASEIPFVVLKGPAVAHVMYPDPAWRCYGDLDLLVRSTDWPRACDLLYDVGFARRIPEPRRGFDLHFGKAVTHQRGQVQVDLHRTLAEGPFGLWMDAEEIASSTALFHVGGTALPRLSDPVQLIHAAVHATLGSTPSLLLPVRDVAQIAVRPDMDWDAVEELAARWRLGGVIAYALRTASVRLSLPLPRSAERIALAPLDPSEKRALAAFTTVKRSRGGTVVATVRAIPSLKRKAQYVRSLVFPTRAFIGTRNGGRGFSSYMRRWAVPLKWLRRTATSITEETAGPNRAPRR